MKDRRPKLLEQLRGFLMGSAPEPEVDEYDLVEAYDYAGDVDEQQLQDRIIDYALRRFPDFQPLQIRKALLMLDCGERAAAIELASKVKPEMTLRQIFDLLVEIDDGLDAKLAHERLGEIIDSHKHLNDEDVIRVLDTAMNVDGGFDWLDSNIDRLRQHTDYKPVLIYEMAQYARDENRLDDAARYVEELTMLEPFETDYWEMLGELYISLDEYEKATSALEYSSAINPSSPRTRLLRAWIDIKSGKPTVDTIKEIEDIVLSDKLGDAPLSIAVKLLLSDGKEAVAVDYITRYLKLFPLSIPAIDMLLLQSPGSAEAREALEYYYSNNPSDNSEYFWQQWASHHYQLSNFEGTVTVYEVFSSHARITDWVTMLQALYFCNRPAEAIKLIIDNNLLIEDTSDAATTISDPLPRAITVLLLIMAFIRTNNEKLAVDTVNIELQRINSFMTPAATATNIGMIGYETILRNIREGLANDVYPDHYDPFLHPANRIANADNDAPKG